MKKGENVLRIVLKWIFRNFSFERGGGGGERRVDPERWSWRKMPYNLFLLCYDVCVENPLLIGRKPYQLVRRSWKFFLCLLPFVVFFFRLAIISAGAADPMWNGRKCLCSSVFGFCRGKAVIVVRHSALVGKKRRGIFCCQLRNKTTKK